MQYRACEPAKESFIRKCQRGNHDFMCRDGVRLGMRKELRGGCELGLYANEVGGVAAAHMHS